MGSAFTQVTIVKHNYRGTCTLLEYLHCMLLLLLYSSEVNGVRLLHYMYLIPVVTSQMWMNDVKYNQVLNQTVFPPGVNPQATNESRFVSYGNMWFCDSCSNKEYIQHIISSIIIYYRKEQKLWDNITNLPKVFLFNIPAVKIKTIHINLYILVLYLSISISCYFVQINTRH